MLDVKQYVCVPWICAILSWFAYWNYNSLLPVLCNFVLLVHGGLTAAGVLSAAIPLSSGDSSVLQCLVCQISLWGADQTSSALFISTVLQSAPVSPGLYVSSIISFLSDIFLTHMFYSFW